MENFRTIEDLLNLTADTLDDSNAILSQVSAHPWNASTRRGLLARAILEKRITLASNLREATASLEQTKFTFAQYTPNHRR